MCQSFIIQGGTGNGNEKDKEEIQMKTDNYNALELCWVLIKCFLLKCLFTICILEDKNFENRKRMRRQKLIGNQCWNINERL